MAEQISEPVINVYIARALKDKGLEIVIPEIVLKGRRPDIIVDLYGLRLLLEGRKRNSKIKLYKDITEKLMEGYGDVGIALLYSEELYSLSDIAELDEKIEACGFSGAVFYWSSEGLTDIGFRDKKISELVGAIREVLNIYIKNDILRQQIEEVDYTIEDIVKSVDIPDLWLSDKELLKKLALAVGLKPYGEKKSKKKKI